MPRFVARRVTVEAHQNLDGTLPIPFAGALMGRTRDGMVIKTGNGPLVCRFSDWVVRGADGQFQVMKQAAFEMTFERQQTLTLSPKKEPAYG